MLGELKNDRQKIFWLWALIIGALLAVLSILRFWIWLQPPAPFPMPVQDAPVTTLTKPTIAAPSVSPQVAETNPTLPLSETMLPAELALIIPVAGIKPEHLSDTFNDARAAGRTHNAIDIMAPRGMPVLAAAEGEIVRLFESEAGGTTLYQLNRARKVVFYYAHLERYAEGVVAGRQVKQGEVIAYVGDTGNAGAGNYHLHFGVWLTDDPKRFWDGTNLNPYELLKRR